MGDAVPLFKINNLIIRQREIKKKKEGEVALITLLSCQCFPSDIRHSSVRTAKIKQCSQLQT